MIVQVSRDNLQFPSIHSNDLVFLHERLAEAVEAGESG
jgi:hypothetical protein